MGLNVAESVGLASQEPGPLTARQVQVYVIVTRYYDAIGEPCPARHVAKQLAIHHEAVRGHFASLCRKGWLVGGSSPAVPRRPFFVRDR